MDKDDITYEQPDGWMQKLTTEVDGTTITRHTFTKDRIGVNDIPIYIQNENGNYSPKHQWQGLTDAENEAIIQSIWEWGNDFPYDEYRICIEQALKDKNT